MVYRLFLIGTFVMRIFLTGIFSMGDILNEEYFDAWDILRVNSPLQSLTLTFLLRKLPDVHSFTGRWQSNPLGIAFVRYFIYMHVCMDIIHTI